MEGYYWLNDREELLVKTRPKFFPNLAGWIEQVMVQPRSIFCFGECRPSIAHVCSVYGEVLAGGKHENIISKLSSELLFMQLNHQ